MIGHGFSPHGFIYQRSCFPFMSGWLRVMTERVISESAVERAPSSAAVRAGVEVEVVADEVLLAVPEG
jgi:hypothetical protein